MLRYLSTDTGSNLDATHDYHTTEDTCSPETVLQRLAFARPLSRMPSSSLLECLNNSRSISNRHCRLLLFAACWTVCCSVCQWPFSLNLYRFYNWMPITAQHAMCLACIPADKLNRTHMVTQAEQSVGEQSQCREA